MQSGLSPSEYRQRLEIDVSCVTYHDLVFSRVIRVAALAFYLDERIKVGGIACSARREYPTCPATLTMSVLEGKADCPVARPAF
jgi:hypothetical protein